MTLSFLNLLKSAAARRGLDYDAGQVSAAEAQAVAEALNECAKIAWDYYPWPWASYRTQTAGMEYLGWDTPLEVYAEEPMAARARGRRPAKVEILLAGQGVGGVDDYRLYYQGAVLADGLLGTGTDLWYLFQKAPPRFSATAYDAATSYNVGESVYYGGHCYRAQDSGVLATPAVGMEIGDAWLAQTIPVALEQAVLAGVERWFARVDGQPVSAQALRSAMQDRLEDTLRDLTETRGQYGAGRPAHR